MQLSNEERKPVRCFVDLLGRRLTSAVPRLGLDPYQDRIRTRLRRLKRRDDVGNAVAGSARTTACAGWWSSVGPNATLYLASASRTECANG